MPADPESDPDRAPEGAPESRAAREAREAAAWRSIVAHYGETPSVGRVEQPLPATAEQTAAEVNETDWFTPDQGERFVPPPAPPVSLPASPARRLAWAGVLLVPVLVVLFTLTHWAPPGYVDALLLAWFVSGFGFLVATMRRDEDRPWGSDDGAVV